MEQGNDLIDVFGQSFTNTEFDPSGIDFDMGFMLDDDEDFNEFDVDGMEDPVPPTSQQIKLEKGAKPVKATTRQNKKRKFNPDAAAIAQVTEETLKSLELDPNSKDGKKKKRQIRNRMSAQYHRDRKNAYIQNLEQIVNERTAEIRRLRDEVNVLVAENNSLRSSIHGHGVVNAPARYDPASCPTSIAVGGYTDNEDSDEYSVQSSGNSSQQQQKSSNSGSFDLTLPPTLPSIHTLPVFQRQQQFEVNFLPPSQFSSGTASPTEVMQVRAGPFASSPLSRSLTLISMVCVISIMFLGSGGRSGPSMNANNFSGSLLFPGGSYLENGKGSGDSNPTGRRLLISTAPEDSSSDSAMVVVKHQPMDRSGADRRTEGHEDLSDLFMSFSLHVGHNSSTATIQQQQQEEEAHLSIVKGNNSSSSSVKKAAVPTKRHLRRALEESEVALNNMSAPLTGGAAASSSPVVRLKVEKGSADQQQHNDGLSVVRLPFGYKHSSEGHGSDGASMFPNKGLYRLPDYGHMGMSESVVFMSAGKALLDPAILSKAARRVPSATVVPQQPLSRTIQQQQQQSDTVRVMHAAENNNNNINSINSNNEKNSGALVPTAFNEQQQQQAHASSVIQYSTSDKSIYDLPDLTQTRREGGFQQAALQPRQQVLSQLLSESNMLTIQLPVSSIAMGKARRSQGDNDEGRGGDEGSEEGGLEAILRALNLQGMGGAVDGTGAEQVFGSYPQGGMFDDVNGSSSQQQHSGMVPTVEFSCMIVNAKLVMKNSS